LRALARPLVSSCGRPPWPGRPAPLAGLAGWSQRLGYFRPGVQSRPQP